MNWPFIANKNVFDFLEKSIKKNKLARSYIFKGSLDLGKATIAKHFAKILFCQNKTACGICLPCQKFNRNPAALGDLHILEKKPDKKNILIEDTREFINKLSLSSFADSYKIGIIKEAQNLNPSSSNALLKTLEEPREKVIIILTTSRINSILPTIQSRTQILNFNEVEHGAIYDLLVQRYGAKRDAARDIARLSFGRPGLAIKLFQDKNFYKDYLEKTDIFLGFLSKSLNQKINSAEKIVKKSKKNETRKIVDSIENLLSIGESLIRDLILLEYGQNELIQHYSLVDRLNQIKQNLRTKELLELMNKLSRAREYLKANVAPKTVLESFVISL